MPMGGNCPDLTKICDSFSYVVAFDWIKKFVGIDEGNPFYTVRILL